MERHKYEEELKKQRRLLGSLRHEIDYKHQQLSDMENKYNETTATLRALVDGLISKINSKDCELQDWELRYNRAEIKYRETVRRLMDENTMLRDKLVQEIGKVKSENSKLQFELRKRTKELEKCKSHYDPKGPEQRNLSNGIEVLKENLPCQNVFEVDKTSSAQVAALRKELEEKSEAFEDLESRYKILTVKQNITNQELQEARKEAIDGLKDMLNARTTLAIKRMGEVDLKAFQDACSLKFPDEDWQEICAKLCSSWEQNMQDPNWHPFKMIHSKGKSEEVVDEDDEKLKELRDKYGKGAFEAVRTALMEMNEYNGSGRYVVPEMWNRNKDRRATMKEIVEYIIKQWKTKKRKRSN